jgi:hypothetical protein
MNTQTSGAELKVMIEHGPPKFLSKILWRELFISVATPSLLHLFSNSSNLVFHPLFVRHLIIGNRVQYAESFGIKDPGVGFGGPEL